MNCKIDDVIAHNLISMKPVIYREGEVSHHAHPEGVIVAIMFYLRRVKEGAYVFDVWFCADIELIIQLKRHMKGVRIGQERAKGNKEKGYKDCEAGQSGFFVLHYLQVFLGHK
ncbi:hypothetical protein NBG4_270015 [Candidatus Sulfobium mesophilum]|uniref:Uncharacterized protein n=1 Tax=Candidatus Sulfobium mesophilum TaxID=2016548 RepID=A0A2U3QGM1_9BACT|nr:hypothetical protein NBG4_270015 [Candidatus Sulfobium mesophilum]